MRNLLYILSILISNQLFSATFFVDGASQSCFDHGEGSSTSPFCHIQTGINAIEASNSGCGNANFNCVDDLDSCGEFDSGPQLNFAQVCTVQVAIGTYLEQLTIQKDMVIISQSAATMINSLEYDNIYNPDDYNTYIENLDFPTISPPISSNPDECILSTITIRPDTNLTTYREDSYLIHPHVNINGFIIESGEGTIIKNGATEQYSRVGGVIFAYLSVPQVINCIFMPSKSDNIIFATDDPDDINYPASGSAGRYGCSFNDSNLGAIDLPNDWEINLSHNSYYEDSNDSDGSIDRPLAAPQIFINGFTNNTVDLTNSLFTVYDEIDITVSEYWVKGRKDGDGEVVEFNFSGSQTMITPIDFLLTDSATVEIDNQIDENNCDGNRCGSIHAALARIIPSPELPIIIDLPLNMPNSNNEFTTIPIIDGISIRGEVIGDTKTILDASSSGVRIFSCHDVQNPMVTISNIEIKEGLAPNDGDGGGILLDNCSPTFKNVTIANSASAGKGGGMYLVNQSNPQFIDVTIKDNSAKEGGGIYIKASNPKFNNTDFKNNSSTEAGGGAYIEDSNPQFNGGSFKENNGGKKGGGLALYRSDAILDSVIIDGNVANSSDAGSGIAQGGGIYMNESNPELKAVQIINNISSKNGGGLYCDNSNPRIYNIGEFKSKINYNIAEGEKGAGIFSTNGSALYLNGVIIDSNIVTITSAGSNPQGVGIFIENHIPDPGGLYRFELTNISIAGNYSSNRPAEGTGIYILNHEGTISGGNIELNGICDGCDADSYGSIYIVDSKVVLETLVFTDNVVSNPSGITRGVINIINSDSSQLSNVAIINTGNPFLTYKNGIFVENTNPLIIENVTINGSENYGVQVFSGSRVNLKYVEITQNANGIHNDGSDIFLQNVTIADNGLNNVPGWGISSGSLSRNIGSYYGITNSIIWNNKINLDANNDGWQNCDISYSNYGGYDENGDPYSGEDGIETNGSSIIITWEETNIDSFDAPLFNEDDYTLQVGSPCVDTGVSDIDGDGNEDITNYYCQAPDMGAYELYEFDDENNNLVCDAMEYYGCTNSTACNYDPLATTDNDSCKFPGDLNYDGIHNVLDIVILSNCILAANCDESHSICIVDMNGDGFFNVLDIVTLGNCTLAANCGGRIDDANESRIIMKANSVYIEAEGFIGGVQMTLTHHADFSIEMTKRALHADYITTGNETRLLVITPETDELFSFIGDIEITEIIVANSQNEVSVDITRLQRYNLSEAYPNPFNPSTNISYSIPLPSDILLQVYDLRGRIVETLFSGYKTTGKYSLTWNADSYSSGLYFIKMTAISANNQADTYHRTRRLLFIK